MAEPPTRTPTYTVSGRITDSRNDQVVVDGAHVCVGTDAGFAKEYTRTDGRYTLPLLQAGTYTVSVNTGDKYALQRQEVTVDEDNADATLDFRLELATPTVLSCCPGGRNLLDATYPTLFESVVDAEAGAAPHPDASPTRTTSKSDYPTDGRRSLVSRATSAIARPPRLKQEALDRRSAACRLSSDQTSDTPACTSKTELGRTLAVVARERYGTRWTPVRTPATSTASRCTRERMYLSTHSIGTRPDGARRSKQTVFSLPTTPVGFRTAKTLRKRSPRSSLCCTGQTSTRPRIYETCCLEFPTVLRTSTRRASIWIRTRASAR